jgi:small-conductance mechanosensitive channel
VLATASVILNLLGLLSILRRVMSIPVIVMGGATITLWTIVSAAIIFLAFFFASRLLRAYLDYRIYPRLGIDQGLGYVLNTLLNYAALGIGVLIALKIVGLDLRFLLVFAGAVGIGVGLGLQSLAANIISGFSIIFGGKVRKGDWIEMGGTLGEVTDIYLASAKIRTRDNIEYLVPNADLVTSTIVNYSLSSAFIRMDLSVGVSYDADPQEVERILLDVAAAEPLVSDYRDPAVRFVAYGDNSINFELLFWIDVRRTPRRRVRSALYFKIFEALRQAAIEIPFPQRDLHIRSGLQLLDTADDLGDDSDVQRRGAISEVNPFTVPETLK